MELGEERGKRGVWKCCSAELSQGYIDPVPNLRLLQFGWMPNGVGHDDQVEQIAQWIVYTP